MIYAKTSKANFGTTIQPSKATKQADAVFVWQKYFFRKTRSLRGINDCKI